MNMLVKLEKTIENYVKIKKTFKGLQKWMISVKIM